MLGCHVEPSKNAMKAYNYCRKEGGLEGPLTYGVPPAALNKKGDKAARNKLLVEMGAAAAVDAGHIRIEDYVKVDACIKAYKMVVQQPDCLDAPRRDIGMWIWGPPDTGKTSYVL